MHTFFRRVFFQPTIYLRLYQNLRNSTTKHYLSINGAPDPDFIIANLTAKTTTISYQAYHY